MSTSAPVDPRARPQGIYGERLEQRKQDLAALSRRDSQLSRARVACFLAFLALLIAGWQLSWSWLVLGLPILAFLVLAVIHERVVERRDRAARAVEHYEAGLARLAGKWVGKGTQDNDYVAAEHPFAADLDLFGPASLFELLCRARTRAGEERLAAWLTVHAEGPVEIETIRARQRSVRALRKEVDLREDLAVLGDAARFGIRPRALIEWGKAPALIDPRIRRWLGPAGIALPVLAGLGGLAWGLGFGPYALVVVLAVEGIVYRALNPVLTRVMGIVDAQAKELTVLAAILERIEQGELDDPRLEELRARLETGSGSDRAQGEPASQTIARLGRLTGYYEAQRNALFAFLGIAVMWGPNFALAIERWREQHGPAIEVWIDALAEVEALSSLACFAFEHPDYPEPELVEGGSGSVIEGQALAHPLLGREVRVANDLALGDPVRAHVVSGSNMSGKSTFLRTVGVNVVLALAGAPVCAKALRVSPLMIGGTLRVQDSLADGASRFWAELVRLRTVSELSAAGPTLFLLDEIFHGTNSHDRRIGAEALLRSLIERGAIGLLTTHDLALAKAAEALAPAATNVHFEDQLREGELVFDYRMREGVVRKSNALELMRSVGLEL